MNNKILIHDKMNGFANVYIFKKSIDIGQVEKIIKETKKELGRDWTLDDIYIKLSDMFPVSEVIFFDGFIGNIIEVNDI